MFGSLERARAGQPAVKAAERASITGCVFIILINNGKNSYYYTLEYMKQRLFGTEKRRRKLGAAEQEHMSKDNTHIHTHAVVRARFLKRKIHTHKKKNETVAK